MPIKEVKKQQHEEKVEYEPMDEVVEEAAALPHSSASTSTTEDMVKKEEGEEGKEKEKENEDERKTSTASTVASVAVKTSSGTVKESTGDGALQLPSTSSTASSAPAPAPGGGITNVNVGTSYDFASKGVPEGPVAPSEFLEPCKAISTLQIARDVRSNPAMERSTQLSLLPNDIWDACHRQQQQQQQQQNGKAGVDNDGNVDDGDDDDDDTTYDDYSKRIPSTLLDLDIDEELSSLELYQDIIERQRKAREKLIHLLLKSRCKFGADDAASFFHTTMQDPTIVENLNKRKQVLQDALELEGADTAQIEQEELAKQKKKTSNNSHTNKKLKTGSSSSATPQDDGDNYDLPPFGWYTAPNTTTTTTTAAAAAEKNE